MNNIFNLNHINKKSYHLKIYLIHRQCKLHLGVFGFENEFME